MDKTEAKSKSKELNTKIGANLRKLRTSKGWSQEYLAETIGRKDYSAYGKIEQGHTALSFIDACIIADLYNIKLEKIIDTEFKKNSCQKKPDIEKTKIKTISVVVEIDGSQENLQEQFDTLKKISSILLECPK